MNNNYEKITQAQEALGLLLDVELAEITESIASTFGQKENPYTLELPEDYAIDLPLEVLASYVARSANRYAKAARSSGIAKAKAKLAKGRFESKYKRSKVGKNETEREQNAMDACQEEHAEWTLAESLAEVMGGIEAGARVISESSRKTFGAAENQQKANDRETKGFYREQDFSK